MLKDKPDLSKVYEVTLDNGKVTKRWLGYWSANRDVKKGETVTIEL